MFVFQSIRLSKIAGPLLPTREPGVFPYFSFAYNRILIAKYNCEKITHNVVNCKSVRRDICVVRLRMEKYNLSIVIIITVRCIVLSICK